MPPVNLCALCAAAGKTCCQGTDILVTGGDISRIRLALTRTDFTEERRPCDPADLGGENDPAWTRYTLLPDGRRRVLKQQTNGDCIFLTPTGCILPLSSRPLICRLHPLQYTETGFCGVCTRCPGELLPAGTSVLACMDIDPAANQHWHRQLYQELRDDYIQRTAVPERVDLTPQSPVWAF